MPNLDIVGIVKLLVVVIVILAAVALVVAVVYIPGTLAGEAISHATSVEYGTWSGGYSDHNGLSLGTDAFRAAFYEAFGETDIGTITSYLGQWVALMALVLIAAAVLYAFKVS